MSRHLSDKNELEQQLEAEIKRFREIEEKSQAAWESGGDISIEEWELLKAQRKDAVEEIRHLHRKLYPYFPRAEPCPRCGCDCLPVSGHPSNAMRRCIACDMEWVKPNDAF